MVWCKSEYEVTRLAVAVAELTKKLSGYNVVEYGLKIVFLPVIAAAGYLIEFGLVDVRNKRYHGINRYDLRDVGSRVQCFVKMINIFRLIRTMAPHIPANPTPLFKTNDKVTFYDSFVTKIRTPNNTCPNELYECLGREEVRDAV
jgi:hypothetical protein